MSVFILQERQVFFQWIAYDPSGLIGLICNSLFFSVIHFWFCIELLKNKEFVKFCVLAILVLLHVLLYALASGLGLSYDRNAIEDKWKITSKLDQSSWCSMSHTRGREAVSQLFWRISFEFLSLNNFLWSSLRIRFIHKGNSCRRRLEVLEPLRWEVNMLLIGIVNVLQRHNSFVRKNN